MLWWLKSGQVKQHQELSWRLGRDGSTISRWLQKYRVRRISGTVGGQNCTRSNAGNSRGGESRNCRRARISPKDKDRYGEIVQWLEHECGVSVEYKTVHQTVR